MEEQKLDLWSYWRILMKWWWLLLAGVVVAAVAALIVSLAMTPIYVSSVKVLVQGGQAPGTPSVSDIQASLQLAQNYADLIETRPVLAKVVEDLSLPYNTETLKGRIEVHSLRSIIEIKISDPNPNLAATMANTVAHTFIDQFRDRQFTQIAQFQASLNQYGIAQDPSIVASQAATMSTLSIAEEAVPAASPSSPRTGLNALLAALLGLVMAALVVLVLEYLDDRIRSPEELSALTGLSNLGSVLRYQGQDGVGPITLSDVRQRSALAESYKFLRTNLSFATLGTKELKTLLITSANPSEGKTTTAANLAISVAKEGRTVILVDADLRKPGLKRIFNYGDHKGLTNILLGNASLEEALIVTPVEGLRVLSSGPLPPDPTVVLRSPLMKEVLKRLQDSADVVIFDSPPLLAVTDPMLLASMVGGALLVIDARRTGRNSVKLAAEMLGKANLGLVGTVLNKVSRRGGGGYYYYYYDRYYSSDGKSDEHRVQSGRSGRGLLSRLFQREKENQKDVEGTQP